MPAPFLEIGTIEHMADGSVITIAVPTGTVAVFNAGGRIFAIDDGCVRCGASLAEGLLVDVTVTCPHCDWRYDIETGSVQGIPSLRTDTYVVKVVGCRIMVASRKD
jgi:nitrite reductase/ring-hydroxylating ferredoxin subunit